MPSSDSFEAPYKADDAIDKNEVIVNSSASWDQIETLTQQQQIDLLAEKYNINQKKLMRKLDFRIVPAICILYLLAFLDRVNISNANHATMRDENNV